MIKINYVEIEQIENAGCNNGNYPMVNIYLDNGDIIKGQTCRCMAGCANTFRLPTKGSEFVNEEELWNFLEG